MDFFPKKASSTPFGAGDVVGDDVPPVATGGYSHLPPLGAVGIPLPLMVTIKIDSYNFDSKHNAILDNVICAQ
jgi:hypothetical protein